MRPSVPLDLPDDAPVIAEFYIAVTRRCQDNGLELSAQGAFLVIRTVIAPICFVLHENRRLFSEFHRLLADDSAQGKQVHDAWLVDAMLAWRASHILTLNERHFLRYRPEGVVEAP